MSIKKIIKNLKQGGFDMHNPICSREICTGCSACYNICPVQCIEMKMNEEGFEFPLIDLEKCIDCNKCKSVCPMINSARFNIDKDPLVYASWNREKDIRYNSSSGGVFTALANSVLNEDGIVYGAAYDEHMIVRHIAVTNREDIKKLQGSKYVQSDIGNTYSDVKLKLKEGKKILFSGTPCQIAGLKNFIGYQDNNLITCDLLCHGVPSPQLFNKHIRTLEEHYESRITDYKFRDKRNGWGFNNTVVIFNNKNEKVLKDKDDTYIYGFVNCFSLRNSCYKCKYTQLERVGDITLGDFWGIGEIKKFEHSTKDGISLILVNSLKGQDFLETSVPDLVLEKRTIEEVNYNTTKLSKPIKKPLIRDDFYKDYSLLNYEELSKKYLCDKGIKGLIKKVIPSLWIYRIRKLIRS